MARRHELAGRLAAWVAGCVGIEVDVPASNGSSAPERTERERSETTDRTGAQRP